MSMKDTLRKLISALLALCLLTVGVAVLAETPEAAAPEAEGAAVEAVEAAPEEEVPEEEVPEVTAEAADENVGEAELDLDDIDQEPVETDDETPVEPSEEAVTDEANEAGEAADEGEVAEDAAETPEESAEPDETPELDGEIEPDEAPEAEEAPAEAVELPVPNALTYTGEAQALLSGEGWLYSLDGEAYSAEAPAAVDAGEYTVYFIPADEADAEAQSLTVTIAKADVVFTLPVAAGGEA